MKVLTSILLLFLTSTPFVGKGQDPQNMKVENQKLDCNLMKTSFSSMEQMHTTLDSTVFAFKQEVKTTKREGVKKLNYYSCDNEVGFLLIRIGDKEFLYKNYPRYQWKLLIESNDMDEFYNENIRNKYLLAISG